MMPEEPTLLTRVIEGLLYGVLAGFGGAANYVNATVMKGKPFVLVTFIANLFISFFVGNLAGEFISVSNEYKDGLIMACGYCTFPVLAMVEVQFMKLVTRFAPKPPQG